MAMYFGTYPLHNRNTDGIGAYTTCYHKAMLGLGIQSVNKSCDDILNSETVYLPTESGLTCLSLADGGTKASVRVKLLTC